MARVILGQMLLRLLDQIILVGADDRLATAGDVDRDRALAGEDLSKAA